MVCEQELFSTPADTRKNGKLILFTTATCPNCKMAKTFLDRAGMIYEVVLANENAELAKKYGIRQAPTLVIDDGMNFETIVNVSNIRRFIDEQSAIINA